MLRAPPGERPVPTILDTTELSPQRFAQALSKGLGRAVVHVRRHGDRGVREALLAACLHNPAYDLGVLESRVGWLMGMLDCTEDPDFYFEAILARLAAYVPDDSGSRDPVQWCDFALLLARRGFAQARPLLYRAHEQAMDTSFSWLGDEQILELDGLDGLAWLVRCVGEGILAGTGEATDRGGDTIVAFAKEKFGAELVTADLRQRAAQDPAIAAYLAAVEDSEPQRSTEVHRRSDRGDDGWIEALRAAPNEFEAEYGVSGMRQRIWGKRADEASLERVFGALLQERERIPLWRHLAVFGKRELPRLHPRLFELAGGPDPDLARAAIDALRHTAAPEVLALGRSLLAGATTLAELQDAVAALTFQFEAQDIAAVLAKLPRGDALDRAGSEDVNRFGGALLGWVDQRADVALADALLWLYEATPCSECRHQAVADLLAMQRLPAQLAVECRDDVCEQTRALVRDLGD